MMARLHGDNILIQDFRASSVNYLRIAYVLSGHFNEIAFEKNEEEN